MEHDPSGTTTILAAAIAAIASIIVAYLTTRRGKARGEAEAPFKPQESGEHAHTRDIVRQGVERIIDRIELGEVARGMARQSDQLGISAKRIEERGAE